MKIAINGFGRIGRQLLRVALKEDEHKMFVAANDLSDAKTLAHLLKYDSAYGALDAQIGVEEKAKDGFSAYLVVNGHKVGILSKTEPDKLPWKKLGIDIVIESTGIFTDKAGAEKHLKAGAKKVIVTAPSKSGEIETFILGVNDEKLNKAGDIINNASCTTNCLAPIMKVLCDSVGVRKSLLTTVHAYTADQRLQDAPHKDLRRSRAAAFNIVPTTTGAADATAKTIPELKGIFDGIAMRVPVIVGSISDIVLVTKKKTSVEEINEIFKKASDNSKLKDIVAVTEEPLVSSDIVGTTHSAIVDLSLTRVVGDDLVKVVAWYDNEWAYSYRLLELIRKVAEKL